MSFWLNDLQRSTCHSRVCHERASGFRLHAFVNNTARFLIARNLRRWRTPHANGFDVNSQRMENPLRVSVGANSQR